MSKRLLLTGAGGAIGVHFIAHFMQNTDWEIVCIDSFRHKGTTDRIVRVCQDHKEWLKRLHVFTHDLNAPMTRMLINEIGYIDYVINLASDSHVDRSIEDPVRFIQNNVNVALYMLEYARIAKPEFFIQFSTDEVYGPAPKGNSGHDEWAPIIPSNPYSASKAAQEAIAISYWRTYGVPVVITNTMNNFGEMQDPEKFPAMVQRKVARGEVVPVHFASKDGTIGSRFYLHSRNTADAILFILQETEPYEHQQGIIDRPDRYNIVGEQELNNLELATKIAKFMKKDLDYELVDFHRTRPGHDLRYGLDGSKLAHYGWKPPESLDESLKNVVKWQQKNSEWL